MSEADLPERLQWGRQMELFGGEPAPAYGLNPDEMRAKLHTLLAEARAAKTMPWPPLRARLYRMMFPQMTFWLPEEEGAQLRFQFETEFARLDAGRRARPPFDIHLNAILKKRTLTNLYNERPAGPGYSLTRIPGRPRPPPATAAYGWPADLADEQILERLFQLNQQRAAAQ